MLDTAIVVSLCKYIKVIPMRDSFRFIAQSSLYSVLTTFPGCTHVLYHSSQHLFTWTLLYPSAIMSTITRPYGYSHILMTEGEINRSVNYSAPRQSLYPDSDTHAVNLSQDLLTASALSDESSTCGRSLLALRANTNVCHTSKKTLSSSQHTGGV